MSKRKGDVQVIDYIVSFICLPRWLLNVDFFLIQRRGWEPEAVLNWLALAGWGVRYGEAEKHETTSTSTSSKRIVQEAPESTMVMNLPDLIQNAGFILLRFTRILCSNDNPISIVWPNRTNSPQYESRPRKTRIYQQASSHASVVDDGGSSGSRGTCSYVCQRSLPTKVGHACKNSST